MGNFSHSGWYQPFSCGNRVLGSCSQGGGCAPQQFRAGIYKKQAISTSPLLPRPKAKAAPPRSMGVEFGCFNSAAAWHDIGWGVGWETAHMDAGKPWVGCGFVLGVTRVSVLVLPYEACDSHATLAAPNPDQPWLPNPARLQAWASPCRTAPCHTQLDHLPPLMLLILDAS